MKTAMNAAIESRNQWPDWASWVTQIDVEFNHVMCDPDAPADLARLGPRPDQLHEGLNAPVKGITAKGLLLWLPDGAVVLGDWSHELCVFSRRDGAANLALSEVRAWAALPMPIAQS